MNQRPNRCRPVPSPCAPKPLCPPPPCPPPCPPKPICPPKGVLLPRILASGRAWQRRACVSLYVGGLPADTRGALHLTGVSACGEADWELAPQQSPCDYRSCCRRPSPCLLRVNIPVVCQVQVDCGSVLRGESLLTTDVALPIRCAQAECWRNQMVVLPCVRLIDGGAPICAESCAVPVFECTLEVLVEAYMTRWEACGNAPACPDLPLFPPPPFTE